MEDADGNDNLPVINQYNASDFATTYPSPANFSSPKSSGLSKKPRKSRRYLSSPYMVCGHVIRIPSAALAEYYLLLINSRNGLFNTHTLGYHDGQRSTAKFVLACKVLSVRAFTLAVTQFCAVYTSMYALQFGNAGSCLSNLFRFRT